MRLSYRVLDVYQVHKEWMKTHDNLPKSKAEKREYAKLVAKKVRVRMRAYLDLPSKLCLHCKYSAAHTLRWCNRRSEMLVRSY